MNHIQPNIEQIIILLEEISEFVNFKQKEISNNIYELLINVGREFTTLQKAIDQLNEEKEKKLRDIEELKSKLGSYTNSLKQLKLREDKYAAFMRQIEVKEGQITKEKPEQTDEIALLNVDLKNINSINLKQVEIITQFQEEIRKILDYEEKKVSEISAVQTEQIAEKLLADLKNPRYLRFCNNREKCQTREELHADLRNRLVMLISLSSKTEQEKKKREYVEKIEELKTLTYTLKNMLFIIEEKNPQLKSLSLTKEDLFKKLRNDADLFFKCNTEVQKETINSLGSENKNMPLLELKFELISSLLSAKIVQNDNMRTFKELLNKDFMAFANEESSLANEAEVILQLKEIENELDIIAQFPVIYKKNIIAIGGAFSSGKSEFINSFLANKTYKLPVGINPVTAIPTYVVSDSVNNIKGYSNNGAAITIDSDFYQKLSHDFVKSFKFNLKDIMPFVTMGTPLEYFENICFIDTPGYNPGSTDGYTSSDRSTAEEYASKSKALIWMLNIEDGVLQNSDVGFLENLDLEEKKLFIVANKADRIPQDSIEDTLYEIAEVLDDYEIEYEGISAYSAIDTKEFYYIKKSLFDFLSKQNSEKLTDGNNIIPRVNKVIDMYDAAIKEELQAIKCLKNHMHSLELDLLQEGFEDENKIVSNRIQEIRKAFDVNVLEDHLKVLARLKKEFNIVLEEIFENL